MTTTTATEAQITYATNLQTEIIEKLDWNFDRDMMRGQFTPAKDEATMAQVRELRAEGRTDEAKALSQQARADAAAQADANMDAYLARRSELAEVDITALDKEEISAFIDDAKRHQF